MRKVKVFVWKFNNDIKKNEKVEKRTGIFHEFGCNYEEFETGAGNYSTAIIEYKNGEIENVPVDLIQFIDNSESK